MDFGIVNLFIVFILCWCSGRFYVPLLLVGTFCDWQNVSSALAVMDVPGRALKFLENWRSSWNFSGSRSILCLLLRISSIGIEGRLVLSALLSAITPGFASAVGNVHRFICECHQTAQKLFKEPKLPQSQAQPCCAKNRSWSLPQTSQCRLWRKQFCVTQTVFSECCFPLPNVSRGFICQHELLSEPAYLGIKSSPEATDMYQSKWQIS